MLNNNTILLFNERNKTQLSSFARMVTYNQQQQGALQNAINMHPSIDGKEK